MLSSGNFDFFVNIGTYKPKYVLTRLLITSVSAVILIYITGVMTRWAMLPAELKLTIYAVSVLAFNSVTEINLFIIRLFKRWRKLGNSLYIQILTVLFTTLGVVYFWVEMAEKLLGEVNLLNLHVTQIVLIIGLLIIIIHILIIVLSNLTRDYLNSRKEIDELTRAKLVGDYNQLRDRLNPHFLFNNLSVLKSLIHYSPDEAEVFTENFTNVYRYMLKCHDQKTVLLQEEVKFLHAYIALHKERIGNGLRVNITIDDADFQKEIPPLSLQLLVENAIKHNAVNRNHPLFIDIVSDNTAISVKNNLNKKETTYSTQTGLKALEAQYRILIGKSIIVEDNSSYFKVTLPLL